MFADLRAYLIGGSAVSTLVGTRVYPVKLPQNPTYPAVTYEQVSGVRDYTLCGPNGLAWPRVTISSWALSYSGARALADAVRQRISGFHGEWGSSPPTQIGSVHLDNELDLYEDEAEVYRVAQDYIISFNET